MKSITSQQAADFLEVATITTTTVSGSLLIHKGRGEDGQPFITLDDASGTIVLITSV